MKTPVLMIHGMSCTGEVWNLFRTFFESHGVRVYTPTLRPEQRVSLTQKPPRSLGQLGLADYVADLEQHVRQIEDETGETPAAIGHSMGGLLAQALAERDCVAAAVSISPAASAGVYTPTSRLFWSAFSLARRFGLTPPLIRANRRFVYPRVLNMLPASERAAALGGMVWESGRAFADFAHWPVDASRIQVPLLTVAARRDRLVPASLVRLTGKKFAASGGEFLEYDRHGHWLYSEPGWETPAQEILDWLRVAIQRPNALPSRRPRAAADAHA